MRSVQSIAFVLLVAACRAGSAEVPHLAVDAPQAQTIDAGAPQPAAAQPVVRAVAGDGQEAADAPAPAPPPKVKIAIRSTPSKASVTWGKRSLGVTPIVVERPRDSGPMDLVLTAKGYLPLHTRAFTFKSDVVWSKLVKIEDKANVLGAKKEPVPVPEATPAVIPGSSPAVNPGANPVVNPATPPSP